MDKESVSSWVDIKKYEDMLANDPKSYCFTLLSELYRKLGLLDDAINVASRGIEIHPEYIGGYVAIGRAYFEKGMQEESKKALERVVKATPDNLLAQKLLSQIYVEQGDVASARKTLQVVELLNPEDEESRLMREALDQIALKGEETANAEIVATLAFEEEDGTEENEYVFIDDLKGNELYANESECVLEHQTTDISSGKGPLATATLAELYVSQGFLDRAINVYHQMLENEPENDEYRSRLMKLKGTASCLEIQAKTEEVKLPHVDTDFAGGAYAVNPSKEIRGVTSNAGVEDRMISILECWLDNIKRGRYATKGDTQKYC